MEDDKGAGRLRIDAVASPVRAARTGIDGSDIAAFDGTNQRST
jgi:hypothetical protein